MNVGKTLFAQVKEFVLWNHLDASLYTCLQILSVSVFEKTEVSCALQPDQSKREPTLHITN